MVDDVIAALRGTHDQKQLHESGQSNEFPHENMRKSSLSDSEKMTTESLEYLRNNGIIEIRVTHTAVET